MGSDLREAIIEDRVEERIQKMLESGELYTAEQMAEQMSKQKEELLIESNVEVVKRMIADGWSLDKSIQMIPSDIREKVRSRFKE
ncbi:MAG: hypothetical protein IKQ67_03310 [Candidatus Methanomethylophilaceae archaeon]|nr:hypothetical protein [Candidatus Methanomethylophilaceae archaeon]